MVRDLGRDAPRNCDTSRKLVIDKLSAALAMHNSVASFTFASDARPACLGDNCISFSTHEASTLPIMFILVSNSCVVELTRQIALANYSHNELRTSENHYNQKISLRVC